MYINTNEFKENTYDAIVVGSGISGGWAAKELTEKGLKVLVLERGRNIEHVKDYKTALTPPWEFPHGDRPTQEMIAKQPIQNRTGFVVTESTHQHFVNDLENPYLETKRFDWIRGYHVGGRSLMWGRVSLRWSDIDFEANLKEGIGIDWPIRYKDIAPWYDHAEKFAGVCGNRDGLPHLPDGQFQPPIEMSCAEDYFSKEIRIKFDNRYLIHGRGAHLTKPTKEQTDLGRASCQSRNLCMRGCPFGAYFSSQAATLPAARRTGNLTIRPHSIVNSIIYDEQKGKAKGVRVIDEQTGKWHEFYAKIVFLNASALGSTFILLNSTSNRFPNGMDDSGQLGHNVMDHHFRIGAYGELDKFQDKYYQGSNPVGSYVPRYRNIGNDKRDYLRGFGYETGASRSRGTNTDELAFGSDFKNHQTEVGNWNVSLSAFGECLPYYENKVELSKEITDKWGQPVLKMDAEFKENEMKMRIDMKNDAAEMLEKTGFKNVGTYDETSYPGLGIHEMGMARMGKDPKTSVLNKWNQVWGAKNVFVTDGAFMTSASCVNPSLTYMAMTARAADYAVKELRKGNL